MQAGERLVTFKVSKVYLEKSHFWNLFDSSRKSSYLKMLLASLKCLEETSKSMYARTASAFLHDEFTLSPYQIVWTCNMILRVQSVELLFKSLQSCDKNVQLSLISSVTKGQNICFWLSFPCSNLEKVAWQGQDWERKNRYCSPNAADFKDEWYIPRSGHVRVTLTNSCGRAKFRTESQKARYKSLRITHSIIAGQPNCTCFTGWSLFISGNKRSGIIHILIHLDLTVSVDDSIMSEECWYLRARQSETECTELSHFHQSRHSMKYQNIWFKIE